MISAQKGCNVRDSLCDGSWACFPGPSGGIWAIVYASLSWFSKLTHRSRSFPKSFTFFQELHLLPGGLNGIYLCTLQALVQFLLFQAGGFLNSHPSFPCIFWFNQRWYIKMKFSNAMALFCMILFKNYMWTIKVWGLSGTCHSEENKL